MRVLTPTNVNALPQAWHAAKNMHLRINSLPLVLRLLLADTVAVGHVVEVEARGHVPPVNMQTCCHCLGLGCHLCLAAQQTQGVTLTLPFQYSTFLSARRCRGRLRAFAVPALRRRLRGKPAGSDRAQHARARCDIPFLPPIAHIMPHLHVNATLLVTPAHGHLHRAHCSGRCCYALDAHREG